MDLQKEQYATIDREGYWDTPTPHDVVRDVISSGQRVYLRFGGLPSGYSRNHRDRSVEAGISVWRGWVKGTTAVVDLRQCDGLSAALIIGERARSVYVVQGKEIGQGSDREPLLDSDTATARKVPIERIVLLLT
ncbi:MAG: hypothetical protein KM310_00200 [Clostridiales bacterium]|nr:hypothetical protein [Clostridiales bacterium]